jgi:exonuclease VII large subunit
MQTQAIENNLPTGEGLTFEKVWATIQETDRQLKESIQQMMQKTDRQMQETAQRLKETDRIVRRNSKQMGDLHRRFGELAEHLVAPGIAKRFNERGAKFDNILPGGIKLLDENGKVKTEIDLLLENGETIVAVEVKTRPVEKDINHHLKRLEILRDHRKKHNEKPKKIWGAIAGAVFGTTEKIAAMEAGLYVLVQSGDTMQMEVNDDFTPRQW